MVKLFLKLVVSYVFITDIIVYFLLVPFLQKFEIIYFRRDNTISLIIVRFHQVWYERETSNCTRLFILTWVNSISFERCTIFSNGSSQFTWLRFVYYGWKNLYIKRFIYFYRDHTRNGTTANNVLLYESLEFKKKVIKYVLNTFNVVTRIYCVKNHKILVVLCGIIE